MAKEIIAIVEFEEYDGKYINPFNKLYFKSKREAMDYLEKDGYKKDEIHEWIKDYSKTATIRVKHLM
jgi:hypothetical protein